MNQIEDNTIELTSLIGKKVYKKGSLGFISEIGLTYLHSQNAWNIHYWAENKCPYSKKWFRFGVRKSNKGLFNAIYGKIVIFENHYFITKVENNRIRLYKI